MHIPTIDREALVRVTGGENHSNPQQPALMADSTPVDGSIRTPPRPDALPPTSAELPPQRMM